MKQLSIQILNLLLVLANGYIVPDPVMPVNTNYLGSYNEYNDLKVQTDSGIVQGEIKPNQFRPNFQVRQFIGIPYAQKPIDIYRFSKPQPFVPELYAPNTIINTRQEVKCIQARNYRADAYVKLFENIPESEDCLYLNVYTPRIRVNGPKYPVLVYLHGGEYKVGSKYIKYPEQLVDSQTIVVSINYRLGIFGFLSFDNEYLPGNLGIHDVILALKWVNREITRFNGDTNMVTLFGHDSGAIIANLLMVSNFADEFTPGQRLFHRVILSGGSIFSPFALDHFPRYQTQMLSIEVGCGQHQFNGRNLLQCLREKSPSELLKVVDTVKSNYIKERQLYLPDGPIPDLDFRPIIDSNRTYPLFRRNPVDMFENDEYQKEIPVIVILTEYEGSHYLYQMENELRLSTSTSTGLLANQNMYNSNQLNFTDVVARLISPYLRPDSNLGALSSAVFYHYFTEYMQRHNGITNKQIFDQEAFTITANMMGDFLQYGPAHRLLKRHSLNSPLAKFYIFDFGNRNDVSGFNRRCMFWPNAQFFRCPTHSEDIYYLLFNQQPGHYNPSNNLVTLIKQFSHAEQMEQINYYSPNRPGFYYRRLNAIRSSGINFRSLESMQFWSEHFVRLQRETIHEQLYFPVLQYQDFQVATYSLAVICSLLFVLLFGVGVFFYRKRSEEKRTLKLLKARNAQIQARYEDADQLDQLEEL